TIKRENRSVILSGIVGPLLKVNGKQSCAPGLRRSLVLSPGETQKLKKLNSVFRSIAVIGEECIKEIKLAPFVISLRCIEEKRWRCPLSPAFLCFDAK